MIRRQVYASLAHLSGMLQKTKRLMKYTNKEGMKRRGAQSKEIEREEICSN